MADQDTESRAGAGGVEDFLWERQGWVGLRMSTSQDQPGSDVLEMARTHKQEG